MSAFTSSMRFPTYSYSNLQSILASVIPIHKCHFLVSSYNPITDLLSEKVSSGSHSMQPIFGRKSNALDVFRRLILPKNIMASMGQSKLNSFLALWTSFSGDIDYSDVLQCRLIVLDSKNHYACKGDKVAHFCSLGSSQHSVCSE